MQRSIRRFPAPLSDSRNPATANSGNAGTCTLMSIPYASSGTVSSTPLVANITSEMPPSTAKIGTPATAETIITISSGSRSARTTPVTASAASRSGVSIVAGSPDPISQETAMISSVSDGNASTTPRAAPSTPAAAPARPEPPSPSGRPAAMTARSAMSPKPTGMIASTARRGSTPTRADGSNPISVNEAALTATAVVTATVIVVAPAAAQRSYGAGSLGRPALRERWRRSRVATMPLRQATQTARCLT